MRTRVLQEKNYAERMQNGVEPYLAAHAEEFYWERESGHPIHVLRYRAFRPRGVVVISHGFTENAEKYKEIVYYFIKEHFHVYLPEHCGHGKSYRLVDDPSLVYVDSYHRYVEDLLFVARKAKAEACGLPLVLYSHSMGGGIAAATYRVDGGYSDHRRPDSVTFTRSLRADLLRRDFTMNALAYNPQTGLVDICGGAEDLARGVVRCVGEPERRFREDGLRILRALRFASVLGFTIEPETAAAIHRCAELLRYLAAERMLSELTKLLCGQNAGAVLREFSDVLAVPIPELRPMFGFAQHNPHHDRDVWQHTVAVVEHIPPEPVLRWAALLHDVGKPPCFSLADDGVGHFYGHAAKSTELADAILTRLRMDTAGRTRITQLIRYHDLPIAPEAKPIRRLMHKLGVEPVRQLFALHIADTCGQSTVCAGRVQTYQEAGRVLDALLAADACFSLRDLAVNGSDLLALGLRGRAVGAALQACLDAVMDERVANEREALLAYAAENLHRFANS